MLLGLWIAWNNYIRDPKAADRFVAIFPGIYQFVSNKWYFDELYDASSSARRCGSAACSGTAVTRARSTASDRTAPLMRSASATAITYRFQSGYLYSYALVMLLGLIGAASWAIWWAK